jgi:hypothetical protein
MSHLIPVGGGLGVQIPPHIISAGHLEDTDLLFEVTPRGVLIRPEPPKSKDKSSMNLAELIDASPFKGIDFDAALNTHPRAGWEKYYAAPEKEQNLLEEIDHEFSEEDWQWK